MDLCAYLIVKPYFILRFKYDLDINPYFHTIDIKVFR